LPFGIEFDGDAAGARGDEADAAPPCPPVEEPDAVEPCDLAAIAHDDVALGDTDDLGLGPDHTCGLDRYGPDANRRIRRMEIQPALDRRRAPEVPLDTESPAVGPYHAAPQADAVGVVIELVGSDPVGIVFEDGAVFVVQFTGPLSFIAPEGGAGRLAGELPQVVGALFLLAYPLQKPVRRSRRR
jgi:hypothetical protein